MSKLNAVQVNLVEDIFDTKSIDPEGKMFDKCSRIFGESESFKMGLIMDFHSDIFAVKEGDKLRIVITKNVLNDTLTDVDDDHEDDAAEETDERLANSKIAEFDYVTYGKIYRIEPAENDDDPSRLKVYISYGGLLMQLTGDASNLKGMTLNRYVYCMVKKLAF